jgi:hypothetical protein
MYQLQIDKSRIVSLLVALQAKSTPWADAAILTSTIQRHPEGPSLFARQHAPKQLQSSFMWTRRLNAYFGLRQDLVIVNGMCKHVSLPDQPLLQRFISVSDDHDSLMARFPLPHDFTFVAARRSVSTSVATPHRTSDIPTYPKQTATDGCTPCKVDFLPSTVSSLISHLFSLRLSRSRSYSSPCYLNFTPDQPLAAEETHARMTSDTTAFPWQKLGSSART